MQWKTLSTSLHLKTTRTACPIQVPSAGGMQKQLRADLVVAMGNGAGTGRLPVLPKRYELILATFQSALLGAANTLRDLSLDWQEWMVTKCASVKSGGKSMLRLCFRKELSEDKSFAVFQLFHCLSTKRVYAACGGSTRTALTSDWSMQDGVEGLPQFGTAAWEFAAINRSATRLRAPEWTDSKEWFFLEGRSIRPQVLSVGNSYQEKHTIIHPDL